MTMNRRDFGKRALVGAAAVAGFDVAVGSSAAPPLIIDTHVHLWDLKKFRLPWIDKSGSLNRSFLLEDYIEAAQGLGVSHGIYMEVDVTPEQHVAEAEYVLDLCSRPNGLLVGAVIGGRPASPDFPAYIDRFRKNPKCKGVRQVLHGNSTPPGYCLGDSFQKGARYLGKHGLIYDLCMRSAELSDGVRLVDACPDTQFILDHCGNPSVRSKDLSQWRDDIKRLADRKNVVCKVSGIVASAAPAPWTADDLAPIINHVLDSFGPDRVVFGGDWPVCTAAATLRQWVEALRAVVRGRSEADQQKLFHENATRVYRLE